MTITGRELYMMNIMGVIHSIIFKSPLSMNCTGSFDASHDQVAGLTCEDYIRLQFG